jgi:hypothetical protein
VQTEREASSDALAQPGTPAPTATATAAVTAAAVSQHAEALEQLTLVPNVQHLRNILAQCPGHVHALSSVTAASTAAMSNMSSIAAAASASEDLQAVDAAARTLLELVTITAHVRTLLQTVPQTVPQNDPRISGLLSGSVSGSVASGASPVPPLAGRSSGVSAASTAAYSGRRGSAVGAAAVEAIVLSTAEQREQAVVLLQQWHELLLEHSGKSLSKCSAPAAALLLQVKALR